MSVFVDTSALTAVIDRSDRWHESAATRWRELVEAGERLRSHSYVLVEIYALVQARLGMEAVRAVESAVEPLLDVTFVDEELHSRATTALLAGGRRDVSLVDWTSFVFMRREGISTAFAFDEDFRHEGFSS